MRRDPFYSANKLYSFVLKPSWMRLDILLLYKQALLFYDETFMNASWSLLLYKQALLFYA